MKFMPSKYEKQAINEYEMYTYLGAINIEKVENDGIPSVYYYGRWRNFIMMAITLLDPAFDERVESLAFETIDILIIFREFVSRQTFIKLIAILLPNE